MRGQDLNLRPSGYEPDELPGCSTPRQKKTRRPECRRHVRVLVTENMFEVSFVFNKICLTTIMFNRETIIWSLQTWQRPTLPHLKMQYHRRWRFSRPSSGWDRVQALRYNHQVSKDQITTRCWLLNQPIGLLTSWSAYWVVTSVPATGQKKDRVYSISLVYAANSRWSAFVSLSHQRLRWRPVRIIRQHQVLMLVWIDHYTWRLVEQSVRLTE